jgi:hypothetical protein
MMKMTKVARNERKTAARRGVEIEIESLIAEKIKIVTEVAVVIEIETGIVVVTEVIVIETETAVVIVIERAKTVEVAEIVIVVEIVTKNVNVVEDIAVPVVTQEKEKHPKTPILQHLVQLTHPQSSQELSQLTKLKHVHKKN